MGSYKAYFVEDNESIWLHAIPYVVEQVPEFSNLKRCVLKIALGHVWKNDLSNVSLRTTIRARNEKKPFEINM